MSPKDRGRGVRPDPEEPEELTVVVMRFKGSGDTMRKGFDTVSQALNALLPPPAFAPPRTTRKLSAGSTPPQDSGDVDQSVSEQDYEDAEVLDAEEAPTSAAPKRARDRKPPKVPNLVNTLDYQSPMSLADYVRDKKPKNATEKYLVVAGWFRHHRASEVVSVDEMFTCFSVMDWKDRPEDMGQLFRNLKSKQQWFDNGPEKGTWKLTIKGLNQVDNKMGMNASE